MPLGPTIGGREVGKIVAIFCENLQSALSRERPLADQRIVVGYVVVFTFTAYLTRGLQFLFGTSKRAMTERAEELGTRHDDIPLTEPQEDQDDPDTMRSRNASSAPLLSSHDPAQSIQEPIPAQDPSTITGTGGPPSHEQADAISLAPIASRISMRQSQAPLTRAQKWATAINARLDIYTYLAILFLVGLPIFFTTGYAMPAQLPVNILAYFLALELPPLWRRYLHPALVASVITIVGVYILTACRGQDFTDGLLDYRTRTTYLRLFSGHDQPRPGAGDFLSSVLDVSIVALAMPMYQYRSELKRSVRLLLSFPSFPLSSPISHPILIERKSSSPYSSPQSA
jgi:hypothetical protein